LGVGELARQITAIEDELSRWMAAQPQAASAMGIRLAGSLPSNSADVTLGLGPVVSNWLATWRWKVQERRLDPNVRVQARNMERLARRHRTLRRQMASLAMARQLLSLWHIIHVPIGIALFTAATIHAAAAVYYTNLIR
jgi:hypothetical protein